MELMQMRWRAGNIRKEPTCFAYSEYKHFHVVAIDDPQRKNALFVVGLLHIYAQHFLLSST